MNVFDSLFPKGNLPITEVLPIVDYAAGNCFALGNGMMMDIFQIKTKDLISSSDGDIEYDIMLYTKFYRTFASDFKIVGLNFPTDTIVQQQYVEHKLKNTKNKLFIDLLMEKKQQLEVVADTRTDREYYLFVFSNSMEEYKNDLNIIKKALESNGLIEEIPLDKKESILFKLNNKCTSISTHERG